MVGNHYGKWTVVALAAPKQSGQKRVRLLRQWLCRCDCDVERVVLEKNLKNGESASCGCVTSLGERWSDEKIENRLRVMIDKLGRMPTAKEATADVGPGNLGSAVAQHGGFEYWAERLKVEQSSSHVHNGQAWERHELQRLREQGFDVERQSTLAPFDLLVNKHRVDVKTAHWTCATIKTGKRKGEQVRGFVFGRLKRGKDCDFFLLLCLGKEDGVEHRFVVPAENARITMLTVTERTLGGFGKYSPWHDRLDLLG